MLGWFGDHCAFLCGDVGVASAWLSPCFVSALRFRVQASSFFVQCAIRLRPGSLFLEKSFMASLLKRSKCPDGCGTMASALQRLWLIILCDVSFFGDCTIQKMLTGSAKGVCNGRGLRRRKMPWILFLFSAPQFAHQPWAADAGRWNWVVNSISKIGLSFRPNLHFFERRKEFYPLSLG